MNEHSKQPQRIDWAADYNPESLVAKVESLPELEGLAAYQAPKNRLNEAKHIFIQSIVEPTSAMGKHAFVHCSNPGWSDFEIICDEGTPIGGTDEAPCPLAYFVSGAAFCLSTHLQGHLRHHPMRVQKLKIEMRAEFLHIPPNNDRPGGFGGCAGFTTYVVIDSDEPAERIQELVSVCEDACMAMQTIVNAVPVTTKVLLNGNELA